MYNMRLLCVAIVIAGAAFLLTIVGESDSALNRCDGERLKFSRARSPARALKTLGASERAALSLARSFSVRRISPARFSPDSPHLRSTPSIFTIFQNHTARISRRSRQRLRVPLSVNYHMEAGVERTHAMPKTRIPSFWLLMRTVDRSAMRMPLASRG